MHGFEKARPVVQTSRKDWRQLIDFQRIQVEGDAEQQSCIQAP
jgi:hypothetical protein